ncbi:MAG: MltA domain-containing protein [SAR324 cluster bacterium]|nr:MltA domain-containing protein [SAR324 cluster bacterium]
MGRLLLNLRGDKDALGLDLGLGSVGIELMGKFIGLGLILILFYSCQLSSKPVSSQYRGGDKNGYLKKVSCPRAVVKDQRSDDLAVAIENSIKYYQKLDANSSFSFGEQNYSAREMIKSHKLVLSLLKGEKWYSSRVKVINELFDCYLMVSRASEQTLFTGYFSPVIEGSRKANSGYKHLAYGKPDNLKKLALDKFRASLAKRTIIYRLTGNNEIMPYYSRKEINEGAVRGKAEVVAWLADRIDFFFLQIQGSGIIKDKKGNLFQLDYAGANGREYKSIGKLLVDKGVMELKDVSLHSIQAYLRAHPKLIDDILNYNESYVFFQAKDFDGKIIGSMNEPLTFDRSAALDDSLPKGALLFVDTRVPDCSLDKGCGDGKSTKNHQKFVLNQDSGGAIKGYGRIDLYLGVGEQAALISGGLRSFGDVYFMVAKQEVLNNF